MRKNENGYIVIETLMSFLPFFILMMFILSLVQIVALESHVHYALTQTAQEISIHSYVSKAGGGREGSLENIKDFVMGINGFFKAPSDLSVSDESISNIAGYADGVSEYDILNIFSRYLISTEPADSYLKRMNVVGLTQGLDFSKSVTGNGDIALVVEYRIGMPFMAVFGSDFLAFPVTQTATTKSWARGNGAGYEYIKSGDH
jgi:hypothetical protein